jgi:hypothetical protein
MLTGCSDGIMRVVKAIGNQQGNLVLANELVTARLAALMAAPCPGDACIVDLQQATLQDAQAKMPELQNALPGQAFGCHWRDVTYQPGVDVCKAAKNRGDLARLALLYLWVRNCDVKGEHLLSYVGDDGRALILGFDHGHCFGNPKWTEDLRSQTNVGFSLPAVAIDGAIEPGDLQAPIDDLLSLTPEQISEATSGVPTEWEYTPALASALTDYLVGSRSTAVSSLINKYDPGRTAGP